MESVCGVLPLSPREERAGRESERGEIDKKRLLSPALSSFFEEERERKRACALKAKLLPNTISERPDPSGLSPDGTGAKVRANGNRLFATLLAAAPVGGLPIGAGESPAPPVFIRVSEQNWVFITGISGRFTTR